MAPRGRSDDITDDPTDGVSEPGRATPHRAWVRVVTVVVLIVFVLAILVGALV